MLNILIGIVVLIAALLGFASTRPGTFRVQRSLRIKASPDRIFPLLNDFHSWSSWSPWEKLDPGMQKRHSGAPSGQGAVYEWEGNKKVGKGRMEITEASRPSRIALKLDFLKPFEAHNVTEFTLQPEGDSTDVTWTMHGPQPFVSKVFSIFMNMDKLIGKDFESGLANLKAVAEKK